MKTIKNIPFNRYAIVILLLIAGLGVSSCSHDGYKQMNVNPRSSKNSVRKIKIHIKKVLVRRQLKLSQARNLRLNAIIVEKLGIKPFL